MIIKTAITAFLIAITQLICANQSARIRLIDIDFYSRDNIDFNINDSIAKYGRLILNYKLASRFSINYEIDSLKETELVKYKIEGFDYNWISDKSCKNIMLTNLLAGTYNIKIGIFEKDKQIEEKNISLIITPSFWKTWWFKAMTTLGFFGIFVIGLIVLAINNSRLRNKLRKLKR